MTSKKRSTWGKTSTWGKSANWNAPKGGKKTTTWGKPEDVARAASKKGGKVRKFLGPLW